MMLERYAKANALLAKSRRYNQLANTGAYFGTGLILANVVQEIQYLLLTANIIIFAAIVINIYSLRLLKKVERMLRRE
jgi:hypothetical protein